MTEKKNRTFGEEIIFALEDAVKNKDKIKIVCPKVSITEVKKKVKTSQEELSKRKNTMAKGAKHKEP